MKRGRFLVAVLVLILCGVLAPQSLSAQNRKEREARERAVERADSLRRAFIVSGGLRTLDEVPEIIDSAKLAEMRLPKIDSLGNLIFTDSLGTAYRAASIKADTTGALLVVDSLGSESLIDSLSLARLHTLLPNLSINPDSITEEVAIPLDSITIASLRGLQTEGEKSDSTATPLVRHNKIFRDTLPLGKLTALSAILPGTAQVYNNQAWKIPIGYAAIGTPLVFGLQQNKKYQSFKAEYDALIRKGASREEIDPVQTEMIRHNTYRQVLFAGTIISYMALLTDGVINYPSETSKIQKATTLSMVCPGAGQIYNGSFWKTPIFVGGMVTMGYIIDWNNRGYQRFKLAYDLVTDGDDATVDEFNGRYDESFLQNLKNQYRRNRDLSIIGMVGVYLLNIMDAHIDAHMQDYDISDDLTMNISPVTTTIGTTGLGAQNTLGVGLSFTF